MSEAGSGLEHSILPPKFMKTLSQRIVEHPLFSSMLPEHQAVLLECASEREFATGEVLFREGDPANTLYLIERGRVLLEGHVPGQPFGQRVPVQELGPGEPLGWSWLFPPFAWHLQASALEPTSVITFNGGHLLATAERETTFGYCLMKRVTQVLIKRLQATRRQLAQMQVRQETPPLSLVAH